MGCIASRLADPSDARVALTMPCPVGATPCRTHKFNHVGTSTVAPTNAERATDGAEFIFFDAPNFRIFVCICVLHFALLTIKTWSYLSVLRFMAPPAYTASDPEGLLTTYLVGLWSCWIILAFVMFLALFANRTVDPSDGDDGTDQYGNPMNKELRVRVRPEVTKELWKPKALRFIAEITPFNVPLVLIPDLRKKKKRKKKKTNPENDEEQPINTKAPDISTFMNPDGTYTLPPDPEAKDSKQAWTFMCIVLLLGLFSTLMTVVDFLFWLAEPGNQLFNGFFWLSFVSGVIATGSPPWFYYQKYVGRQLEMKARREGTSIYGLPPQNPGEEDRQRAAWEEDFLEEGDEGFYTPAASMRGPVDDADREAEFRRRFRDEEGGGRRGSLRREGSDRRGGSSFRRGDFYDDDPYYQRSQRGTPRAGSARGGDSPKDPPLERRGGRRGSGTDLSPRNRRDREDDAQYDARGERRGHREERTRRRSEEFDDEPRRGRRSFGRTATDDDDDADRFTTRHGSFRRDDERDFRARRARDDDADDREPPPTRRRGRDDEPSIAPLAATPSDWY